MNKKAQMSFNPSDFTNSPSVQEAPTDNLFLRILKGLVAAVLLFVLTPVVVAVSDALLPSVCGNATVCLFFKFIVPAYIIGGVLEILKYVWSGKL